MSLINFFGNKKKTETDYLQHYSVDLHSHLIPNVDDGVSSIEESINLFTFFKSIGIKKIYTTPHISLNFPNSPEKLRSSYFLLKDELIKRNIGIELEVGAEYMIDDGFRSIFESGNLMAFHTNFVLIELTTFSPHPDFYNLLFEMQSNGLSIILAHPERYLYWQNDLNTFKRLKDRELLFQMNLLSLTGIYSPDIHKMAMWLIKEKMIDLVGSDIHNGQYIPKIKEVLSGKIFQTLINSGQVKNNALLG